MENTIPKRDDNAFPATPTMLERMAERFGLHARSATAYSEPIVSNGITVVPVAKVGWGFGGGARPENKQPGTGDGTPPRGGGGGGMRVTPVGYIEIKDGQSQFKPIRDANSMVPLVLAGGAVGFLLLRALRKLIR